MNRLGERMYQEELGLCEIINYNDDNDIDVLSIDEDIIITKKKYKDFKHGNIKITIGKSKLGIIKTMKDGGTAKIIKYINNNNMSVKILENGAIIDNITYNKFDTGNIKGFIYSEKIMNNGMKARVYEYRNSESIDVIFVDTEEIVTNKSYNDFVKGRIKSKKIFGVGILDTSKKENNSEKLSYKKWYRMLERCYGKRVYKTYRDCTVCEEWKIYSNFEKWFDDNYYEIEGEAVELDKDILCDFYNIKEKIYSPETCLLVPSSINSMFTSTFETPYFNDAEQFIKYKIEKQKSIYLKALEYKDIIPAKLFYVMINYNLDSSRYYDIIF